MLYPCPELALTSTYLSCVLPLPQTPEERTVQMYNRAGQAYSCLLPDTAPLLQQHREEAEAAAQHVTVPSQSIQLGL